MRRCCLRQLLLPAAAVAACCCCCCLGVLSPVDYAVSTAHCCQSICCVACLQDSVMRPRKAFYRARAHSNPFNDGIHLEIPQNPDAYDW
jgi:hypothetical protein